MAVSSPCIIFNNLQSLSNGSISGAYVAVGIPFSMPVTIICFTNNTDGDMFFSDDGVNDKLFLPAKSFKLLDISTNKPTRQPVGCIRQGTQFYVRQSSAPTTGSVYIESIFGTLP